MNENRAFIHYKAEKQEEVVLRLKALGGVILEISEVLNLVVYKPRRVKVIQLEMIDGVITVTNRHGKALE